MTDNTRGLTQGNKESNSGNKNRIEWKKSDVYDILSMQQEEKWVN